jgi:hypothetical protein
MLGRTIFAWAESSTFKVNKAIDKLKRHKSPDIDQITAEFIKNRGITIHSEIHKLINSICNKQKLPEEWKDSNILHIKKKGDKTDCSNDRGILLLSTTYKITVLPGL